MTEENGSYSIDCLDCSYIESNLYDRSNAKDRAITHARTRLHRTILYMKISVVIGIFDERKEAEP